jgi:hypothetical protein
MIVPKLMAKSALMSFLIGIELSGSWLTPDMLDFGMVHLPYDQLRADQQQQRVQQHKG